ncbi:MAG: sensor histidine kinase [Gammaproteobacteria bacterium]|nr:MAG: sensor histidine kinase [Gammaproteobacteria bacterium]
MTSLRKQLWRSGLMVVLFLSIVLWLGGRWVLQDALTDLVGSRLEHDAETLLAAIMKTDGGLVLDEQHIAGVYRRPGSGHYFVIRLGGRIIHSRSLWDQELPWQETALGQSRLEELAGPYGQSVLVWYGSYRKLGQTLSLAVAEDIAPLQAARHRLDAVFILVTALAATGMLLLQRRGIRRALQPLLAVDRQLDELAEGRRERIDQPVPEEVQPLIGAVNRLAHSLLQRVQRSRNSLGDMAHALKTPLNLLVQDIAQVEDRKVREELHCHANRIGDLIERELRRARIAGTGPTGERWEPERDLADLVTVMRRLYPRVTLRSTVAAPTSLPFDREDMLELVGNLLDNACKWAAGRVALEVHVNSVVEIVIEDDGPGIPAGEREALLGRGSRLDERVDGHGLGLAIVQEIVDSYGGQILFEEPDGGGLRVRVRLPLSLSRVGHRSAGG